MIFYVTNKHFSIYFPGIIDFLCLSNLSNLLFIMKKRHAQNFVFFSLGKSSLVLENIAKNLRKNLLTGKNGNIVFS